MWWMEGMRVRDKIKIGGNAAPRVMFGKEEELGGEFIRTRGGNGREREKVINQPTETAKKLSREQRKKKRDGEKVK